MPRSIDSFLGLVRAQTQPISTHVHLIWNISIDWLDRDDRLDDWITMIVVVEVSSEDQVQRVLPLAKSMGVPVTFRAAGTSLSGQAVTDSVLIKLIPSKWNKCQPVCGSHGAEPHLHHRHSAQCDITSVRMQPGLIGGDANAALSMSLARDLSLSLSCVCPRDWDGNGRPDALCSVV